jgi:hypothetical protein
VLVEEIIMKGRADVAQKVGIPAWKQLVFGKVMPSPKGRAAARAAASAAQTLFAKKIPTGSGLHYRFPEAFGLAGRTVPKLPARGFIESLKPGEASAGDVMLFVGCVFDHVFPNVGRDKVELGDVACCGLHMVPATGSRLSAAFAQPIREKIDPLRCSSGTCSPRRSSGRCGLSSGSPAPLPRG